ncbi:branched-chain amino acid ABC transporter permease [Synergistes jonesii]|uniref:branched-chain amino acid ABC transporter permease n=1 Tax=Synergistes jonesii TaxID=2754 RepID=UPI00242BB755|nr:branched-chain amino acid ABC transporter permease [Synergistes jonesii]
MNKAIKIGIISAVAAILLVLPHLFTMDYYLHIFVMSEIYAVLALSLALIVGFSGQVSMGHAAFYGIGAYVSALLSTKMGLPFWVNFWISGAAAGLISYIIGKLVLRLRGHVLAITTAFFCVLVNVIMVNWIPVTNGPMGIAGIPRPTPIDLFGYRLVFETRMHYYYLGLLFVAIVAWFFYRITTSRMGDNLIGVRENEELAKSLGIDTMRNKIFAFSVGGALAGLAGSFYAHYILFISPVTFTIGESINILVMVIFGGMSTLLGPIFGAILLTILPEFLRMAGALRLVIYGVSLVCFIIWLPQGVWGSIKNWWINKKSSESSE